MSRRFKRKLASRLTYNGLLRLLLFKFWFRLAFLGFVLLVVFLALFLPKIWTASPPGSRPITKVSGVDLVQTWSLKRKAKREMEAGQFERAHFTWLSAIGHNPADRGALGGLLENLLASPTASPDALAEGLREGSRLLQLTGTNRAGLDLMTRVLQKFRYDDFLLSLLSTRAETLTPEQQGAYLKALFQRNRIAEFDALWLKFGAERSRDPELPLYWAAYRAGWGSAEEAAAANKALSAGLAQPDRRILANRLQMIVSAKRNDPSQYQQALENLQDWRQDSALDHAGYWRLLHQNGQKEQAKALAREYSEPLRSVDELMAVAEGRAALGLHEEARQCFRAGLSQFAGVEAVWTAYANLLVQTRQWEELAAVAIQMRTETRLHQDMVGYGYFLQGWADLKMNRHATAGDAFRKMHQVWAGQHQLASTAADPLTGFEYPASVRGLLEKFKEELNSTPEYRQALSSIAE